MLVLPAYAGMIPPIDQIKKMYLGAPRVRGDDPQMCSICEWQNTVLPAYAGMILATRTAQGPL